MARCNALAWMNAVLDLKLVGWEEDLNGQFLSIDYYIANYDV